LLLQVSLNPGLREVVASTQKAQPFEVAIDQTERTAKNKNDKGDSACSFAPLL